MTTIDLSTIIRNEEYWRRRLATQWISYRRERRNSAQWRRYRKYTRHIIEKIREWQDLHETWDD